MTGSQPSLRGITLDTLCPFLYKTRTIQPSRRAAHSFSFPASAREAAAAVQQVKRTSKSKKHSNEKGFNFFRVKFPEAEEKRGRPNESTLTPQERRIFENIKRTFGADVKVLAGNAPPTSERTPKSAALSSSTASKTREFDIYDTDVNNILSLFAPTSTYSTPGTEAATPPSHLDHEVEPQAHEPYPGHLIRAQALKALTHIADHIKSVLSTISSPATSSRSSTSDTSQQQRLWRVTNERILPLVMLLQPGRVKEMHSQSLRNQWVQQLTVGDVDANLVALWRLSDSSEMPLLPLVSILYPAASLLVLRTFARHFASSAYLLALLPKIRESGAASYLLAGNVYFYNTLLQSTWDVYSDLNGIDRLLRDMRRDGVSFDEGTLQVLDSISGDRKKDIAHGEGQEDQMRRGKMWWSMKAHQEGFSRVDGYWRDLAQRDIEAKWGQDRQPDVAE